MRHNLFQQKRTGKEIIAEFLEGIKTENRFAVLAEKLARREEQRDAKEAAHKLAVATHSIDKDLSAEAKRMEQQKQSAWLSMYGQAEPRRVKHDVTAEQTTNETEKTEKTQKRVSFKF